MKAKKYYGLRTMAKKINAEQTNILCQIQNKKEENEVKALINLINEE